MLLHDPVVELFLVVEEAGVSSFHKELFQKR